MSDRRIGVAIVSFNTAALLRDCLRSVVADTSGPILVIDNRSEDGSPDLVRREFPGVRLRVEERNRGYGAAANLALRELGTPYVLLLNADTRLTPGTVDALTGYLDTHPLAAIAGPRIVNPAGRYERSAHRLPTATSLLLHAPWWPGPQARPARESDGPGRRDRLRKRFPLLQRSEWRSRRADWLLGAALAIRTAAFDAVGGFDEAFFLYQEEIDLSYRLRAAGWEIHYAPVATIVHVGGASTSQRATETFAQFVRSTQRFARLRLSPPRAFGVKAVIASVLLARLGLEGGRLLWMREGQDRERVKGRIAAWRRGLEVLAETGLG